MKYKVTSDNIHIEDSYKICSKTDMQTALIIIQQESNNCKVFEERSINSMIKEWRAHNLLYNLGLFKSHTKDVDINLEPWYRIICYNILSIFYKG